jgi:hypothetical protein
MLNEKVLMASLPLTERLDARGLALYPVSGTPLDALCSATRSDSALFIAANGDPRALIGSICTMANKSDPMMQCSEHDVVLDSIAETAISAVKGHIAFARTVVAPAINDLYSRVKASLAEVSQSSLLGMEVEVLREPKPLDNGALQTAIRKFDGLSFDSPSLTLRLPDLSMDELRELLLSGGGGLDADIAEWMAEKGDDFFRYVWASLFQQTFPRDGERVRSFGEWVTDRAQGVDVALAVFLIARKLSDGKPLEGTAMSLSSYQSTIVDFRNQAGAALCRALDKIERSSKSGQLVRDVVGTKTVVYEPVYRRFLEEGGTNEMLFANALALPFATSIEAIMAQREQLAKRWNTHASITRTAESNKRFNVTKDLLDLHFRAQLSEVTDGDEATANNRETVLRLFKECLAKLRESDLNDLYNACLFLVCRARFFKTDAERILVGIEQAKRENPDMSVREAAAASIINYVAYWVGTQLKVVG